MQIPFINNKYNDLIYVKDNNIYFDYKLKEGPSNTTNALKLLEIMDFDSEIINTANHICYNLKRNKPIL